MKKTRYVILFVLLLVWTVLAVFYVPPVEVLGHSVKILFVHVPSAWLSVVCYFLSLYFSIKYLMKREIYFSRAAYFCSLTGTVLIIAATVSGAVWAKIAWNSFWNGDIRQTTVVVLLLIYAAYFAIYYSFENRQEGAKLASVYQIFAAFTVPVLVFVLPRVYSSLHPSVVSLGSKPEIENKTVIVLVYSLLLFSWILAEILVIKLNRLKNEFKK